MIQNHATHPVLNDIRFLVEKVGPRQPATDNEQKASRYIRERMETVLDSVTVDEFATVETTAWLESGFHIEFIIVYLISLMWPLAAACYGTVVLFLFIAESTGIALISRLIRMERSQNVVGRLRNPFATRNVVVVAHYDTPKWTLPYQPDSRTGITIYWLRFAFIVTIVAGAAVAAIGGIPHLLSDTVLGLRTIAAINLAAMVLIRFRRDSSPDFVAGANDNASGVAAMLSLAERLAADRPNRVAMWFIATGSGHAACCGMHRVMEQKLFDPANTLFINIEEVGEYVFYCGSNDGTKLYLDNTLLVDNDGGHGYQEKYGKIKLDEGVHKIEVRYFQQGGGQELKVSWKGPGFEKRELTKEDLSSN